MNATDLIGYTYDADVHCPACALTDYQHGRLVREQPSTPADCDEHGLPYDLDDSEGNPVAPVFAATDGAESDCCGDCGAALIE